MVLATIYMSMITDITDGHTRILINLTHSKHESIIFRFFSTSSTCRKTSLSVIAPLLLLLLLIIYKYFLLSSMACASAVFLLAFRSTLATLTVWLLLLKFVFRLTDKHTVLIQLLLYTSFMHTHDTHSHTKIFFFFE